METEHLLAENPSYAAWWHLARAYHAIAGLSNRFFEERGITGAQFGVLRCLADAGPSGLMLSDLSRVLMVTCGNITGVVDRLEQAGYLHRERRADDRRVVIARLTPAGALIYRETMPAYQELIGELMAGLSIDEREAVASLCAKLQTTITANREAESRPEQVPR